MTAANYPNVLPVTLAYEGGKVNNPKDPGGRTNEGVTQRVYDAYRKKKGLPLRSVYLMEMAERDEIYETQYWRPSTAINQPNGLDLLVFDTSVNSGNAKGKSILTACMAGGGTVSAQITRYCDLRLGFLHRLSTFRTFGKGWTARVTSIEAKALKMASAAVVLKQAPDASPGLIEAVAKTDLGEHAAVQKQKATKKATVTKASAAVTTSAAPVAAATNHTSVMIAVIAVAIVIAAVGGFLAWQHSKRADALTNEAKK